MKLSRITKFILVFALMFNMFGAAAFAKTSRTALITSVSGDVSVTKGGGSNPFPAYPNMPLNQGDTITTGEDGSATVKIADPESERTIGANSEITVSELTEDAGGKKSGFKVWVGSMWNKVKSLATGDEDTVDTPTATMGVRGTRYLVIVNPDGSMSTVVASGLVAAQMNVVPSIASDGGQPNQQNVLLAPTQQLNLNPAAPPTNLTNGVSIVDVTQMVKQADPSIIKAFIVDAPTIVQENNELLSQVQTQLQNGQTPVLQRGDAVSDLSIRNLDDLNSVAANANRLAGNIAASAAILGKVSANELDTLINQANSQIPDPAAKIDPNAKPIDPSAGVDPNQAQKKKVERDRIHQLLQLQQQDLESRLNNMTRQLGDLLNRVRDQQEQLDDENKKKQEDINKQAENSYVSGLTDDESKAFEKNKKELEGQTNPPTPPSPSAPNAPTVNDITDLSTAITGTTGAGYQVSVKKAAAGGTAFEAFKTGTADATGNFSIDLAGALLPAGTQLQIYVTNSAVNSGIVTKRVLTAQNLESIVAGRNYVQGQAGPGSTIEVRSITGALLKTGVPGPSGSFTIVLDTDVWGQSLTVNITSADGTTYSKIVTAPQKTAGSVTLVKTDSIDGFNLDVKLSGITGVYAAELHFVGDEIRTNTSYSPYGTVTVNKAKFDTTSGTGNSVDMIKYVDGDVSGVKIETIYAVTRFNTTNTADFSANETLVSIPFIVSKAGTFQYDLSYILLVDQNGNPIAGYDINNQTVTYTR